MTIPDSRNAMRSFLQRAEVRLSTMHRIAVGFISGAGLLFLMPVFLKDGVLIVIRAVIEYVPTLPAGQEGALIIIYLALLFPFILSLGIPAAALLLLLQDIVRFYFVGHPPGFSDALFNPRFVLTGVAFSPDESPAVKDEVLRYQYGTDLIHFVIPRADAQSRYYGDLIDKPHRYIVPQTRRLPRLIAQDVLAVPSGKPLDQLADDDRLRINSMTRDGVMVLTAAETERTLKEIDRFNAALGLAGVVDRTLAQEVAKTEVSLVRHGLKLRQLVLRYFQALLILIWTSLVTFLMLPFLEYNDRFPMLIVFAIAYFIWSALAPFVIQLPLYWIVTQSQGDIGGGLQHFQKADSLQNFGQRTRRLCYLALASSLLALALEIALQVR